MAKILSDSEFNAIADEIDENGEEIGSGPVVKGYTNTVYRMPDGKLYNVGHEAYGSYWVTGVVEISEDELPNYITG